MNTILLRKTFRDLRASLATTAALSFIILLGITSYIALIGGYRDLGNSYNHTYDLLHLADVSFSVQSVPQSVVDEIAAMDGVAAVTGRLVIDAGLEQPVPAGAAVGEPIRARLIGIPAAEHPPVDDVLVTAGRFLSPNDGQAALIESHFAQIYRLSPGASVTSILNGRKLDFQVAGVAASPEYLIVSPSTQEVITTARTFAVLFVPLSTLQELASAGGTINDLAVRIQPQANADQTIKAIQDKLHPFGLLATTLRKDQPSYSALNADLGGYKEMADSMPAIILIVAAFSVFITLGRQVRAQQTQIGLMKAIGYGRGAIMLHYLAYALCIGVIGCLGGVLLGSLLAGQITTEYAKELGIPLVQTQFYPDLVWQAVLLSLIFTFLAGLQPAFSATRLAPATAIRQDPSTALAKGRVSVFERMLPLSVWLRLALRNVFRVRRRSISTVIGIIFAFILILATWGMIDSMSYMMDLNFEIIARWDQSVVFNSPQPMSLLGQIEGMPGIRQVEPVIQMPATLKAGGKEKDVLLTAFPPDQTLLDLKMVSGGTAAQALAGGKVILTKAMAQTLGLKPSDTATLTTLAGEKTVTVGGTEDEMTSATAYISLDTAQQWMGASGPAFTGLYLTTDPSQANAVRNELYSLPGAASVLLKSETETDWRSLMNFYYAFMGILVVFAAGMAFAVLFNAMTINVLERQRELATMRAIGAGGGRIALLLSAESVILWLLALVPGLLAGYWAAVQVAALFQAEMFSIPLVIYPHSYVICSAGILLTMILAALPAVRRVNRLNLAEATKLLT